MKKQNTDILIIGGGLTGLTLAYLLEKEALNVTIVEARHRLGGRIFTKYKANEAPIELGATWLGKKHRTLNGLLEKLSLEIFEQQLGTKAIFEPISTSPPQLVSLPPNEDPSFRIKGGSSSLISALSNQLQGTKIMLGQAINTIEKEENVLVAKSSTHSFSTSIIISTLAPYLLINTIEINPPLPTELIQIAQKTHTWMGESIKVAFTYKNPFWRARKYSGTIFSNVGPVSEMYDHANYEDTVFGLKGFMNGSYYSLQKEERKILVLNQLKKYYGNQAAQYISYEEAVWRNEPYTFQAYDSHLIPHQNNGNPIFRVPCFNGQFYIAGSETANAFPGYMDGAIKSAEEVYEQIKKRRS